MNSPPLSNRGRLAPASPIRRLHPYSVAAAARGVHVHHLNIGQPDLPTSSTMRAAYKAFDEPVVAYSPSQGTAELRGGWADYYNRLVVPPEMAPITADQVMITVGGSEALLFLLAALCDPGDAILVAEPYYTNYAGFAHLLGVQVLPVATYASEGFNILPERVRAAATDRCRALVVPTPGNPTGAVLSQAELGALAAVCADNRMTLISDEVYREFVYEDGLEVAPSALSLPGFEQRVVVVDSVSKRYSACGARVGCLVTRNETLYAAALKFAQARLSPPTVDQHAAVAALATPVAEMRAAVREYKHRRDVVVAGLNAIEGVSCPNPAGAFYLVADLPVDDAEAFCIFLLQDFDVDGETVMLAPAEGFYASEGVGRNQVRLAYVLGEEPLRRSLNIIAAGLAAWSRR